MKLINKLRFYLFITLNLLFISCSTNNENLSNKTNLLQGKSILKIDQKVEDKNEIREVLVIAPNPIIKDKKYPVVFYFHGNGGNKEAGMELNKLVNDDQFITVSPQGLYNSWNLGQEDSKADDVEFVSLIIEKLKEYSNININKKYAIGYSNGSALVNELAVKSSNFNGIAPFASQLTVGQTNLLSESTNPLSVYQVCGSNDNVIPYEGGLSVVGHTFISAKNSAKRYAETFKCNLSPEITMVGIDSVFRYKNCKNSHEIKFYKSEGGGHGLKGKNDQKYELVWEFFKKH
tara:strand:+ start:5449 stop:6318 length:870 start_codon:yes stop_codon:yes gene_type:complete